MAHVLILYAKMMYKNSGNEVPKMASNFAMDCFVKTAISQQVIEEIAACNF